MKIGDKIRNLRVRHDYTQKELADKIGIKQNTLSDYENDKLSVSLETIELLSKVFDVDRDYFINDGMPTKQENKQQPKSSMTYNLLKRLVEEGIIEDPNNIDENTIQMIINTAKVDLALIKNKKA